VTVTDLVVVSVLDYIEVSHVTVAYLQISSDAWSCKVDAHARNLEAVAVAAISTDRQNQFK